jgi:SAM-dependent methyltransferase
MTAKSRYIEPLRDIAPEAYQLSQRLCSGCRDLHGLWPYIRLSRASTGVEARDSRLQDELRNSLSRGLSRVLIAGAQDTGLLALMVQASAGHDVDITVLDICEAPLALCRSLAKLWSLSITTIRQDLFDLRIEHKFDLVLVHGTLHFIAADRRLEVLKRLRQALDPAGQLVILFNTSRPISTEMRNLVDHDYASAVLAELKSRAVPLPDSEPVLRQRLNAHQRRREAREGAFAKPRDLELLLDQAGFCLKSCMPIDVNVAMPMRRFITTIAKRRYMAIATVKPADNADDETRIKAVNDDRA